MNTRIYKKTRKKTSKEDKIGNKTRTNMLKIEKYLQENGESKTNTIAEHLGLSLARTRKILSQMDSLEAIGTNTSRRYRLKNNSINRVVFKKASFLNTSKISIYYTENNKCVFRLFLRFSFNVCR